MGTQRLNPEIRKFNETLKAFLYQENVLDLLPDCGWLDGGCRSLMRALRFWLGEENTTPFLIVKRREDQHAEHAIVKVGEYFLDADGASTRHALYKRWRKVERLPRVFIRTFDPDKEPAHQNGEEPFYIEEDSIVKLVGLLAERFDRSKVLQLLGRASLVDI